MKSNRTIDQDQNSGARFFGPRVFVFVVLAVSIFFGQTFSAMAGRDSNSPANWIEICGDGGSYLVQVDSGTDAPEPECTHCSICLVPGADGFALQAPELNSTNFIGFRIVHFSDSGATVPAGSERYWSSCRGPPIKSAVITMTLTSSLFFREIDEKVTRITWVSPWV